eukprot:SAG22_NODE_433_length_10557_cov_6.586728_6_plen_306_part_00
MKPARRLFFARKLVYGDSLSAGAEGDAEQLYWYARKRVDTGFYKVSVDDVMTLAAMRMQIELGDHTSETMGKLKVVLKDYIPHTVKNTQSPKEWLEDLCTIHSRMVGFDAAKCKENYIRMCMGYQTFGFTMFTVRQTADPAKPHLNTKVWLGVNSRGLSFFDDHSEPYKVVQYLDIEDVEVVQTRVHLTIAGGDLFFQASVAAAAELGELLELYGASIPKKRKKGVTLRTVTVAGEAGDEEPEEALAESVRKIEAIVPAAPAPAVQLGGDGAGFGDGGLFDGDHDDGDGGGLFDKGGGGGDALFD